MIVPHFAAGDPRVNTAGFVGQTTRIDRTLGDDTFTLMIFAVGDVVTLGAMIRGEFAGTADWVMGDHSFSVPLRRANRGRTDVPVEGPSLVGQHGGFDDYDWVNVDVPIEDWMPDGTRVRLEFRSEERTVTLPGPERWFVTSLTPR